MGLDRGLHWCKYDAVETDWGREGMKAWLAACLMAEVMPESSEHLMPNLAPTIQKQLCNVLQYASSHLSW